MTDPVQRVHTTDEHPEVQVAMPEDAPKQDAPRAEKRQASKKKKEDKQKIILVSYPKIIYMYPTIFVGLVPAIFLAVMGDDVQGTNRDIATAMSAAFLGVFGLNLLVLAVDFPRATSLTLVFVLSTIILGGVVLLILKPEVMPFMTDIIVGIRPFANATFYWVLIGILIASMLLVKLMVQFDYWEVRQNELMHHHGILSDLRRYPTQGLQIEKEITDVFEFLLMRSGRLILRVPGENRAFILDNVPFISSKEQEIMKLLSSLRVKVHTD